MAPPGRRRSTARAFSFCRTTESRWAHLSATASTASPDDVEIRLAMTAKTCRASRPQPPAWASSTIGMKEIPSFAHKAAVSRCDLFFASYAAAAALPADAEAASRSLRMPLVTAKSKAAGRPSLHLGTYTSAGRRPLPSMASPPDPCSLGPSPSPRGGNSPLFSNSGEHPAAPNEKNAPLPRALCLSVRSPL